MIINPIIPIWLMVPICIALFFFKRKGTFHYIRQIIIILLLFIVNLRIMVPNPDAPTQQKDMDVMFVVDNTISMLAQDYGTDNSIRLDAVKEDCAYIMEQLPGAAFSVVSFDDDVKTLIPHTIDISNVNQALQSLNGLTTFYAHGTGFDEVLTYLEDVLDKESEHIQIVFFISDGEITLDEALKSYPNLKEYIDGGAVLGYGTEGGGRMLAPAFDGGPMEELYYYDDNYDRQTALSYIDEANLQSIANDMGIDYVHMTSRSELDNTLKKVMQQLAMAEDSEEEDSTTGYSDTFFYLLIPFIPLLVADFIYYKRKTSF